MSPQGAPRSAQAGAAIAGAAGAETVVHASCVAGPGSGSAGDQARAVLILGPSGSGKSALALRMIGLGARLVADDRTVLRRAGKGLAAVAPGAIRGLIEARGVGLLRAPALASAAVVLAVDLGQAETHRLPPAREWEALGCRVPLLLGPPGDAAGDALPAALMLYLAQGRSDMP